VAASFVLHLVLFFFYVRAVSGARVYVPHPAAYRVSLVQLPGRAMPPGGGAARSAPEPKKEEKAVRIPEKPRPMKKTDAPKNDRKKSEKKSEPKAEEAGRTGASPGGEQGSGVGPGPGGPGIGAGSGAVSLEGVDFPFAYYVALIEARIGERWVPPEGLVTGTAPPSATVRFDIRRDGKVEDPRITVSSGISFFDLSAIRAVVESDPFPPLPDGFPGDRLGVNFVFRFQG
jgi:TonB family protein